MEITTEMSQMLSEVATNPVEGNENSSRAHQSIRLQCKICEEKGKQFITQTIGQMIDHLREHKGENYVKPWEHKVIEDNVEKALIQAMKEIKQKKLETDVGM